MSYVLTPLITGNIKKESLKSFLSGINKYKEFVDSNEEYDEFITKLVNTGYLSLVTLNNYLFDELFFGYQRSTYIYKINSFSDVLKDETKLINLMNSKYSIDTNYFNKLATTYFSNDDDIKELVAFKIIKNIKNNSISKIRLIFGLRVEIAGDVRPIHEHSYIPIEINLKKKLMIVKVAPKSKVIDDKYKPEYLAIYYANKIFSLFNVQIDAFNYTHKECLYEMCQQLYMQVYNKMVQSKPQDIDKVIESATTAFYNTLNIQNLKLKKEYNNIFDIKDNLNKMVEHLLISDILFGSEDGQDIDGIDGLVTYLRFNDGNNVSARLKGENCRDPIFDSETYMALRVPIENAKKLSLLQVIWFMNGNALRVGYDTISSQYLYIHFFSNLKEDEFNYGLEKYFKYESTVAEQIQGMDSPNAKNIAK